MPIYEYRCSACGKKLEALQKLSDSPLTTCPACHAETLVKLVSAAGFQLKGSGWYATDFRESGKPAAKKDGASAATEAKVEGKADKAGASETKTESKSETKSESAAPSSGSGAPPASS